MNHISIIGNLGRDPEMSYTPAGKAVTKFSVAVSRHWTDGAGQRQDHTTWFNVVAWERLGETCNKYLLKGSKVAIQGRMESRDFTDKDGNKRTAWEVIASDMEILTPKGEGGTGNGGKQQPDNPGEGDIPF